MLLNAVEQSLIPIKYSWQHVTVAKKPKASLLEEGGICASK